MRSPPGIQHENRRSVDFRRAADPARGGRALTGRGADLIVIDDPLKPEEALSQTQRKLGNQWYDHTLYSRLNDKQNGAIPATEQVRKLR